MSGCQNVQYNASCVVVFPQIKRICRVSHFPAASDVTRSCHFAIGDDTHALTSEKKEEIWHSLMTQTEKSKKQRDNITNANKNLEYTTIADRLRTVSWSNSTHPTCVVKPVYEGMLKTVLFVFSENISGTFSPWIVIFSSMYKTVSVVYEVILIMYRVLKDNSTICFFFKTE